MRAGNTRAFALHLLDRRSDRTVSRSPAKHQDLSGLFAEHFHQRNISRRAIHFLLTQTDHQMVILGIIVDIAGDVLLLDAADAMLKSWSSRQGPRPSEGDFVARIRHEISRISDKPDVDFR